ncbi:cytochrome C, partial [Burkholderia pseudomallei]|nr:cytochrome C [Burkholderia pseudomallei]
MRAARGRAPPGPNEPHAMNGANMSVKPAQRPERGFAKTRRRTAAHRP